MGLPNRQIPEDYWRAIIECDDAYDNIFFYGVETTRIFCRPSCKSKIPHKDNVHIFKNAYLALEENFRPCKRCKPDELYLPAEEWVKQITIYIDQNYHKNLTLNRLAEISHGSPYHLQRLFTRIKGVSPTEYTQQVRLEKALLLLETTDMQIAEVGFSVGFLNTPYFSTLFKNKIGCTPMAYRKKLLRKHDEGTEIF